MITLEQATSYGTLIGTILVAVFAQINAWKARQTANSVRDDLQTSNDSHAEKLGEIHALVNGGLEHQLSRVAALSGRIAAITNAAEDVAAHAQAVQELSEHQAKQAAAANQSPAPKSTSTPEWTPS